MNKSSSILTPAATLSPPELTTLLNHAYTDYYVPIHLNTPQFRQMCYEESIDLQKSVVAQVNGKAVGVAFLSKRGTQGWLSGVGVVPEWRKKGIGAQILQRIQAIAKTAGIQKLWLEVLAQNTAGEGLYKRTGFEHARDLLVLSLDAGYMDLAKRSSHVSITSPETLLTFYTAFHDVRVPWQRSYRTLQNKLDALQGLGYWDKDRLLGYVLYEPRQPNYAILDLAIDPTAHNRLDIAETLLIAVHAPRTDIGSYVINFPVDDPLSSAFLNLKYRIWQRQHEMVWQIE